MNYEEAKKFLMNSSKAGRIISDGNDEWRVEFLPEREEGYKKNKKKRIDAGIEKRKKEDEEKKQEEKRIKAIEKKKNVLCEKPICLESKKVKTLLDNIPNCFFVLKGK